MDKTEILDIVNNPSKHIQIAKIDGEDSIVYSSEFVKLLESLPTMLTKADMVKELKDLQKEIDEYQKDAFYADDVMMSKKHVKNIIQSKIDQLKKN